MKQMDGILKFSGTGACFNTKFGNTSAYFKHVIGKKVRLVLFDCGESVFAKIKEKNLLNDIDEVFILITHFHTDHVGSLPSLIFYLHYTHNIKPIIFFPNDDIDKFLSFVDVDSSLYEHVTEYNGCYDIKSFKQKHKDNLNSFGYYFRFGKNCIYYSGDSKTINGEVLKMFREENSKITEFYHDVTRYVNDVHMNINELTKIFDENERKRVTLMHFDDDQTVELAKMYGFKVAKSEI